MASLKDSFDEVLHDNNSIIKIFILAIPLYFCVDLFKNMSGGFWTLAVITFIIYLGFIINCTSNVEKGENRVLPSFNIFGILWTGIKGLIGLGPLIAISAVIAYYLNGWIANYIPEPKVLKCFEIAVWGIAASIPFTAYLSYVKDQKIVDAYNIKAIFESAPDILIAILFMIPQLLIAELILIAPVTYICWLFFGIPNPVIIFFWCMVAVFTIAMIGHYMAQIAYENLTVKENEDKII